MNERPSLRQAMRNANIDELDDEVEQAVAVAIAYEEPPAPREDHDQRQRDLDAALADSIEIAARHRIRLGRRVCTRSDGEIVRLIFEALRRMQSETSDLGFPT